MPAKSTKGTAKLGLSPLMNKTKWLELAATLSKIGDNGPICSYKCLADEKVYGPSYQHWDEFVSTPTSHYEWLELHSYDEIYQG